MQQEHGESAREWRIALCKSDQYYNNNSINQFKSVSQLAYFEPRGVEEDGSSAVTVRLPEDKARSML